MSQHQTYPRGAVCLVRDFAFADGQTKSKYVVVLRCAESEAHVPVVVCSTDRYPGKVRAFDVVAGIDGLEGTSRIDCRWVYTLKKNRLNVPVGHLSAEQLEQVDESLIIAFGII